MGPLVSRSGSWRVPVSGPFVCSHLSVGPYGARTGGGSIAGGSGKRVVGGEGGTSEGGTKGWAGMVGREGGAGKGGTESWASGAEAHGRGG